MCIRDRTESACLSHRTFPREAGEMIISSGPSVADGNGHRQTPGIPRRPGPSERLPKRNGRPFCGANFGLLHRPIVDQHVPLLPPTGLYARRLGSYDTRETRYIETVPTTAGLPAPPGRHTWPSSYRSSLPTPRAVGQVAGLRTSLGLLQHTNDLLFLKPRSLHHPSLPSGPDLSLIHI